MENIIDLKNNLKNNPLFQLSLSSKELFHSNFLYWMATTEQLRPVFCGAMNSLYRPEIFVEKPDGWCICVGDNHVGLDECVVLREFKNLDFCICKKVKEKDNGNDYMLDDDTNTDVDELDRDKAGEILFVIENKVKSICTKQQLVGYNQKILEHNLPYYKMDCGVKRLKDIKIDQNRLPKCMLLSMVKEFAEKEAINGMANDCVSITKGKSVVTVKGMSWKIADYAKLSNSLQKTSSSGCLSFSQQIINEYAAFIGTFSDMLNGSVININEDITWEELKREASTFDSIRCGDIFQKNAMHKCAGFLAKKIKSDDYLKDYTIDFDSSKKHIIETYKNGNKTLYIGVNFLHGQALLEIKYAINRTSRVCLQIQGGIYCVGVEAEGTGATKTEKKNNRTDWDNKVKKLFESVGINLLVSLDSNTKKIHSYQNKDSGYFYVTEYHQKESISYTLNKMIKGMRSLCKP